MRTMSWAIPYVGCGGAQLVATPNTRALNLLWNDTDNEIRVELMEGPSRDSLCLTSCGVWIWCSHFAFVALP